MTSRVCKWPKIKFSFSDLRTRKQTKLIKKLRHKSSILKKPENFFNLIICNPPHSLPILTTRVPGYYYTFYTFVNLYLKISLDYKVIFVANADESQ